eukprot:CAMPEP_0170743238 /NCGR_PEP_ID=MMETSP0437-20130122/7162_1 /TAXON_ID=0 /ORGANISM="Sexangularia sp." /LENGTH=59 /DNA_ID=CAMNT_0011081895 /DNA_START=96 /DNA_END=272 /DNA_ORIENTATION=-
MDVTSTDFIAACTFVTTLGILLSYGGAYHGSIASLIPTAFISLSALAIPIVAAAATVGV